MSVTGAKPMILFVDDEIEICHFIKQGLEDEGFHVIASHNAKDARDKLDQLIKSGQPVDLVISDVLMPDESGIEFLRGLRGAAINVPFLFVTAHLDIDNQKARSLGAEGVLRKPFPLATLVSCMREILEPV